MAGPGFETVRQELEARLQGDGVDELLLNGSRSGYLVRRGVAEAVPSPFASDDELLEWLQDLAEASNIRLDPVSGSAGGQWDGGRIRWHAILPPLSRDGPLVSFRRHRFGELTLQDFAGDLVVKDTLRAVMTARRPLLIAGPTGSGKTTLLAALLTEQAHERIVVIEALPELPRFGAMTVRLAEKLPSLEGVGAVSLSRLVRESLRLRPDRLVLGEIRGHEAQAFLQASFTGHQGIIATIHAGNAHEAIERLVLLAGGSKTARAMASALNLVVVMLVRGSPPRLESCRCSVTPDGSADPSPLAH